MAGSNFSGGVPRTHMLWLIFFILLVLWLLGLVGTYTVGAWLHLLLVLLGGGVTAACTRSSPGGVSSSAPAQPALDSEIVSFISKIRAVDKKVNFASHGKDLVKALEEAGIPRR